MTEQELIEQLADKEHASWAHWMQYLFSMCTHLPDGRLVIPGMLVVRWERQANTNYADLSEQEKQSDRDEVAHILPIIEQRAEELEQLLRDCLLCIKDISDYAYQKPRVADLLDRAAALGIIPEVPHENR